MEVNLQSKKHNGKNKVRIVRYNLELHSVSKKLHPFYCCDCHEIPHITCSCYSQNPHSSIQHTPVLADLPDRPVIHN